MKKSANVEMVPVKEEVRLIEKETVREDFVYQDDQFKPLKKAESSNFSLGEEV